MPRNLVQKMLSPEEMQLLGTMQSTLNELLSLNNNGGDVSEPNPAGSDLMEALKKLAGMNNLADNTEQAGDSSKSPDDSVKKENNGPTANENADQRIDPATDINDKNMSEVGKSLINLIMKGVGGQTQQVQKSQQNNNNQSQDIIKALTMVAKRLDGIEQFNTNILDALGFSEKIEKSNNLQGLQPVTKSQNNLPVQNIDATGVVNELVNVIQKMAGTQQQQVVKNSVNWNEREQIRKDLSSAMPLIFNKALKEQR
jgi:hypothetical protein